LRARSKTSAGLRLSFVLNWHFFGHDSGCRLAFRGSPRRSSHLECCPESDCAKLANWSGKRQALSSTAFASAAAQPVRAYFTVGPAPPGMFWIPSVAFLDGAASEPEGVQIARLARVRLSSLCSTESVTNSHFARFLPATHYSPLPNGIPRQKNFPNAPLSFCFPGLSSSTPPSHPVTWNNVRQWWGLCRRCDLASIPGPLQAHSRVVRTTRSFDIAYEDAEPRRNVGPHAFPPSRCSKYAERGWTWNAAPYVGKRVQSGCTSLG